MAAQPSTSRASGQNSNNNNARNASNTSSHPQSRWLFPNDRQGNAYPVPSLAKGIPLDREQWNRVQCAELMNAIGKTKTLNLFYHIHPMTTFHRNTMAPVFIFLAAKANECPRRVHDVITVTFKILHPNPEEPPVLVDTPQYQQLLDDMLAHENVLLQTLALETTVEHPHHTVISCCHQVLRYEIEKAISVAAYAIANSTLAYTSLCVKFHPALIAAMCIQMASKWSSISLHLRDSPTALWGKPDPLLPMSMEGHPWYWYIDQKLTLEQIDEVMSEFMTTIERYPQRTRDKIRTDVLGKIHQTIRPEGKANTGPKTKLDAPLPPNIRPPAPPPPSDSTKVGTNRTTAEVSAKIQVRVTETTITFTPPSTSSSSQKRSSVEDEPSSSQGSLGSSSSPPLHSATKRLRIATTTTTNNGGTSVTASVV